MNNFLGIFDRPSETSWHPQYVKNRPFWELESRILKLLKEKSPSFLEIVLNAHKEYQYVLVFSYICITVMDYIEYNIQIIAYNI